MSFRMPAKDPDEVLDYVLDWTKRLDGDTISTFEAILESGDCTIDDESFSGVMTTVWLSGGTNDTDCIITMRVVTPLGRRMDEVIKVKIKAKEL